MMKTLITVLIVSLLSSLAHADIMKDFDSLGGNDVLINRAKMLQPDKKVKVVQNRIVDRTWRNEFSPTYGNVIGGDAYLNTQTVGMDYHLHINPYWAAGLSYFSAFNSKTKEANYLIDADGLIPELDFPKQGYELLVNFSPIYGKINLFDYTVLHFDIYAIGSYGKIDLDSGQKDTYSVGAGFGLWISQHITSRFELRQRMYQIQRVGGGTDANTTLASFSVGYLL